MASKLPERFTSEEAARKYLEALHWPEGPICPHCTMVDRASPIKGGRKGLWFCNVCRKQFTITIGTVFERSKVPLNIWLYATHLLCSSKKGISSHQLSRMLGVTYKTAWFLAHRLREAMKEEGPAGLGGEGRTVEADEMFVGKRPGPKAPGYQHKIAVLSLVERDGPQRSIVLADSPSRPEIVQNLIRHVAPDTILHTDGAQYYKGLWAVAGHESVNHSKGEYARDGVHVNTLEGFFSVFKRGMVGTYQHCDSRHLHRYVAEFDFRQNTRAKFGIDDAMRTDKALQGIRGKRLTYRKTTRAA